MQQNNLSLEESFRNEVKENILQYWMVHTPDDKNGGFFGEVTNENTVNRKADKSVVICARILWTFSAAYSMFQDQVYLNIASNAYEYLKKKFWDYQYGGVYWKLDYKGEPVDMKKQIYAQAFALYGLSEYYMAVKNKEAFDLAVQLFSYIEEYSHDVQSGGYIEAFSRRWEMLKDPRLLQDDTKADKTMNTHLHILEAYANLYKCMSGERSLLGKRLKELLCIMEERFVDIETGHFKMYYDLHWNSLSNRISYGHDIEGSWLLLEAANILNEEELICRMKRISLHMADAVLKEGFEWGGGVTYEEEKEKYSDTDRVWWVQAEAVIGFYNAFQISGDEMYKRASLDIWNYIQEFVADHENGEWYRRISRSFQPKTERLKIDEWKCPYHNSRMCFEMIRRVSIDGGKTI